MNENKLEVIYEPGSEAEFMIVSSILNEHNIHFYQKNQTVQSLFGHGTTYSGFNPITGPIKILVKQRDYDSALKIINDYKLNLKNNYIDSEDVELEVIRQYKHYITSSIILGLVFPALGVFYLLKAFKFYSNPILTSKFKIYLIISTLINLLGLTFWILVLK